MNWTSLEYIKRENWSTERMQRIIGFSFSSNLVNFLTKRWTKWYHQRNSRIEFWLLRANQASNYPKITTWRPIRILEWWQVRTIGSNFITSVVNLGIYQNYSGTQ